MLHRASHLLKHYANHYLENRGRHRWHRPIFTCLFCDQIRSNAKSLPERLSGAKHAAILRHAVNSPPKSQCYASAAGCGQPFAKPSGPVLPLHERPSKAAVTLVDLLEWHKQAAAEAQAVGSTFADADGGPSAEDLQIELNWLLDDAVHSVQLSTDQDWQPCTWRRLQPREGLNSSNQSSVSRQQVKLRAEIAELSQLWRWRVQDRVPLQYLNNCCHWRDFILAVGYGVLIPRPETELMIDLAKAAMQQNPQLNSDTWLDIGTGSGAIAIGLSRMLPPTSKVYAVEKSPEAAQWAELNIQRLGLADRVQVKVGSFYEPVASMQGSIAGIVSNPPYIPNSQMNHLQAEVGQYEPWLALDGGPGMGLNSLIPICQGAVDMLTPGGFLALETTGGEQAVELSEYLQSLSFTNVKITEDMASIRRFVTAVR